MPCHGCGGAIYGLGFIAAHGVLSSNGHQFLGWGLGVFEALFWPAFLVYGVLKFTGA